MKITKKSEYPVIIPLAFLTNILIASDHSVVFKCPMIHFVLYCADIFNVLHTFKSFCFQVHPHVHQPCTVQTINNNNHNNNSQVSWQVLFQNHVIFFLVRKILKFFVLNMIRILFHAVYPSGISRISRSKRKSFHRKSWCLVSERQFRTELYMDRWVVLRFILKFPFFSVDILNSYRW